MKLSTVRIRFVEDFGGVCSEESSWDVGIIEVKRTSKSKFLEISMKTQEKYVGKANFLDFLSS